jgi:hypothetical protein
VRYAPEAGRGLSVPSVSTLSSLRAAVHSRINNNKKNGMAKSTGSRICGGSTDKKPAKAPTQTDYDPGRPLGAQRLRRSSSVCLRLISGVPVHRLNARLQGQFGHQLFKLGRGVAIHE